MSPFQEGDVPSDVERQKVHFSSSGEACAAWHYSGTNGGCVVMAGGFGVTKEPATDLFAARFAEAGYSVLAFDYRNFGESGGRPRQVARIAGQLDDWRAAIAFAGALPGVDPTRVAIWAFSLSGGHIFRVAARNPSVAVAIAQAPVADGRAATRNAMGHTSRSAPLRLTGRAIVDSLGGRLGRPTRMVPLVGQPGAVAILTTPDAQDGDRALNPDNRYPDWQQQVAARSALGVGFYRPGRDARNVACPLLVLVYDQDESALAEPAIRAAQEAPRAELVRRPGSHYEAFLEGHEDAVEVQLAFLERHLVASSLRNTGDRV